MLLPSTERGDLVAQYGMQRVLAGRGVADGPYDLGVEPRRRVAAAPALALGHILQGSVARRRCLRRPTRRNSCGQKVSGKRDYGFGRPNLAFLGPPYPPLMRRREPCKGSVISVSTYVITNQVLTYKNLHPVTYLVRKPPYLAKFRNCQILVNPSLVRQLGIFKHPAMLPCRWTVRS